MKHCSKETVYVFLVEMMLFRFNYKLSTDDVKNDKKIANMSSCVNTKVHKSNVNKLNKNFRQKMKKYCKISI